MQIRVNEEIEISSLYTVEGLVFMKNGCCEGRPVVITKSTLGGYSCQCSCGGWSSNGHKTRASAVLEYRRMSKGKGLYPEEQLRAVDKAIVEVMRHD